MAEVEESCGESVADSDSDSIYDSDDANDSSVAHGDEARTPGSASGDEENASKKIRLAANESEEESVSPARIARRRRRGEAGGDLDSLPVALVELHPATD